MEIVAVLADNVPMVAVPVDAVMLEENVVAPRMFGIVAVLIVAVPADSVPIVEVPVDAVRLVPNVTMPERRLVPSTAKDPVLCTPVVERLRAEEVLSPSVMT